ncbi:MAG: MgtC/SapB family protein [Candidatus Omnitrophica bacterium]|nr:MgtC/SapB family protein [Candidatus Omnitrophota bacterium]MCB9720093.1 MgtC/SapB family protein [Candidatus Omnitrophota bacterium]
MIGLERQIRGKPVGIRTSILICLGTALFVYLGLSVQDGTDVARVLGQLITGVGFLGAGVIMNRGDVVSGVTSAAVVWLLAGIGAAIGLEHFAVALVISLVTLSILLGVERLEKVYKELRTGVHRYNKET